MFVVHVQMVLGLEPLLLQISTIFPETKYGAVVVVMVTHTKEILTPTAHGNLEAVTVRKVDQLACWRKKIYILFFFIFILF